jgi:colicin import membrane protein
MKPAIFLAAVLLLPLPGFAQDDASGTAQRQRIAAERSDAESAYRAQEKACNGKFAVNDCLNEARAKRRAILADLRRQEVSLNDADRKRRGAERLKANEERAVEERARHDEQKRADAAANRKAREGRAQDKASDRAAREEQRPGKAAQAQEQRKRKQAQLEEAGRQREQDAAANVARQKKREQEAKDRKDALAKRQAERKKPAASALPVPP